jgi:hypothetical protein
MMVRTQIMLDEEAHRRAKRRAAELGISLAQYVRQAVDRDLGPGGEQRHKRDVSRIAGLFNSGGSDIAKHKDEYIGDAVWDDYLRSTGRR